MTGDIQKVNQEVFGKEAARVMTCPTTYNPKGSRGAASPSLLEKGLDPSPEPMLTQEVAAAKAGVRGRKRGRSANILAGRMMQTRQILNTGQLKLGA